MFQVAAAIERGRGGFVAPPVARSSAPSPSLQRRLLLGARIWSSTGCSSSVRWRQSACSACSTRGPTARRGPHLVATAAMAFTAWSYAEMSRVAPHAGRSSPMPPPAGPGRRRSPGGWRCSTTCSSPRWCTLFSGLALHALVPAVPAWVFTAAAFTATTGAEPCRRGGGGARRVGRARRGGAGGVPDRGHRRSGCRNAPRPWSSARFGVSTLDCATVMAAVSIAVLSFLGFIASFAEGSNWRYPAGRPAIAVCLGGGGRGLRDVQRRWPPWSARSHPARWPPRRRGRARPSTTSSGGDWRMAGDHPGADQGDWGGVCGHDGAGGGSARLLFGMARDGRLPRARPHRADQRRAGDCAGDNRR